ncbi:hypothetical protein D3C74_450270 [compost metagenome]
MSLRETKLPRQTGMADGVQRGCPCTSVITADQNNIGTAFGYTGSDRSDTHLRHELNVNACAWIGILQIINQFCQIFDGINIMMRRR